MFVLGDNGSKTSDSVVVESGVSSFTLILDCGSTWFRLLSCRFVVDSPCLVILCLYQVTLQSIFADYVRYSWPCSRFLTANLDSVVDSHASNQIKSPHLEPSLHQSLWFDPRIEPSLFSRLFIDRQIVYILIFMRFPPPWFR